jgi:hypothetical protein
MSVKSPLSEQVRGLVQLGALEQDDGEDVGWKQLDGSD